MRKDDLEEIVLNYNDFLLPGEEEMADDEMKGILGETGFIIQCAWCKPVVKVKVGEIWVVIDGGIPGGIEISQGICPECYEKAKA